MAEAHTCNTLPTPIPTEEGLKLKACLGYKGRSQLALAT